MKKLLFSLLTIALVMGLVGGGNSAYFSDSRTSTANSFTAGVIKLQVGSKGDKVFSPSDDPLPLIFDYLPASNLKPGDSGEVTLGLELTPNSLPSDLWMEVRNLVNLDGSHNPIPGPGTPGYLRISDSINVTVWLDDGNNTLDSSETPVVDGTMTDLVDKGKFPVHYNAHGGEIYYVGWSWRFPITAGNELQGYYCTFDVAFGANQVTNYMLSTSVSPGSSGLVGGGGTHPANSTVPVTASPAAGYSFDHWSGDLTSTDATESILMNGPKSVTANFLPNSYTISFNSNGGSSVADITQDYGTAVSAPAAPTRGGYTFAGWTPPVPATMPVGGANLVAGWTAVNQTLIYDANGGSGSMANSVQPTGTVFNLTSNAYTRAGYNFSGWNTMANGSGTAYADGATFNMPAGGLNLYAQWAAASQTIAYDANTGSGTMTSTTGNTGASVTLTTNAFTKAGYNFSGWNTMANGSGTAYADGATFNMPAGGLNLYAQWAAASQTIAYDANTGSGTMTSTTGNTGASVTLTTNAFTKAGYNFSGWNTMANGSGTAYADGATFNMPAGGLNLYAQWAAINYTVTFDKNGGDTDAVPTTRSAIYNATVTLPTAPGKAGSTFNGWNTLANGSGTAFTGSTAVTADIIVYAQWTAINYTVTFDKNGGDTDAVPTTRSAIYNATVTLPTAPGKAGSTFNGWNTLANGSGTAFTGSTAVTADIIVYAQWTQTNIALTVSGGTISASNKVYDGNTNATIAFNGAPGSPANTSATRPTADADNNNVTSRGNAYDGSDTTYASWDSSSDVVTYTTFNIPIPPGAIVNTVTVDLTGYRSASNARQLVVSVSSDGTSFSATQNTTFGTSPSTVSLTGSSSLWGLTWTPGSFTNNSFKVRIGATTSGTAYLGNLTATVNYTPVSSPTLVGVLPGDTVTLNYGNSTGTLSSRNVGSRTVTANWALAGADAGKYTLTQPTTTASITPRPITVTAATDTKPYDGNTSSDGVPTLTAGTLGTGDSATWTQTFNTPNVGTSKILTPAGSVNDGNSGNNYTVTLATNNTGVITALYEFTQASTSSGGWSVSPSGSSIHTMILTISETNYWPSAGTISCTITNNSANAIKCNGSLQSSSGGATVVFGGNAFNGTVIAANGGTASGTITATEPSWATTGTAVVTFVLVP